MTSSPSRDVYSNDPPPSTSYSIVSFAGIMLMVVAVFQVLEGIAAVAKDEVFVSGLQYVYKFDLTTWGWIHIVLGAIAIATAIGILMDQTWSYVVGIGIAGLSALANFGFLPYYPLWSVIVIAFNVLVIWALCNQIANRSDTYI
jgi:hypothetical protein